jgi:tetratricopeptide (TPR) repeat protein
MTIRQTGDSSLLEGDILGSLGNVYASLGQPERAIIYFQKARNIFKKHGAIQLVNQVEDLISKARTAQHDPQKGTVNLNVSKKRQAGTRLNQIGLEHMQSEQYEEASKCFKQVIVIARELKDSHGEATALSNLAFSYTKSGQHELAIDFYKNALEIILKHKHNRLAEGEIYAHMGHVYAAMGKYKQAFQYLQRARTTFLSLGAKQFVEQVDKLIAEVQVSIGTNEKEEKYKKHNNITKSKVANKNILQKLWIYFSTAVYYGRGNICLKKDDYDQAIIFYNKGTNLDPNNFAFNNNRGIAYLKKGDIDRAIADFTRVIELQPDDADVYNNRGQVYAEKGDIDCAIADFDRVIELEPDEAAPYLNRGSCYGIKGDFDRAIADYERAVQIKPNYTNCFNNLGLAYKAKGNYEQAIAAFDKVIMLEPGYADAYFNRGQAYILSKDHDQAIKDFDRFISLQPNDGEAHINRGASHNVKGHTKRAIADFKRGLELSDDPHLRKIAQEELERLGAK